MDEAAATLHVTGLTRLRGARFRVSFDDGRECVLGAETCAREGLKPGAGIDAACLDALLAAGQKEQAHEAALTLLSYRARSKAEMRRRLAMRGIGGEAVDGEIERLEQVGLLDDDAFARAWVEERARLSPRGRRMLQFELRRRGIGAGSAESATASIADSEIAFALARQKALSAPDSGFPAFAARVGGFLQRRGFDHETVAAATRAAWNERAGPGAT